VQCQLIEVSTDGLYSNTWATKPIPVLTVYTLISLGLYLRSSSLQSPYWFIISYSVGLVEVHSYDFCVIFRKECPNGLHQPHI
jgi:hypothetical protein